MKIAILQCDDVLEKFQPQFGHYHDMIRRLFTQTSQTFEFAVFDCQQQQYPQDIDHFDFYITTGSRVSAYDDQPWIQSLIEFVRQLDARQKPLIGICFGHQIIALAMKQRVEKSAKGWGIGVAQNRVIHHPSWMSQQADTLNIIVSHQDQVLSLTEQAIVIAESDFCPYFVVQWNDHLLSIQGHPEFSHDYSATLINARRHIIPAERIDSGLLSLRLPTDKQLFTRWILDFVDQT